MKILQQPISVNHKSAMFFDGVIAECDGNKLSTYNDGELVYKDKLYVGSEIIELGKTGAVNDGDIEGEITVCILVDKFFMINDNEDMLYDNYDEAIQAFETFLNKKSDDKLEKVETLHHLNLNSEEKKFAGYIINHYGDGQHPIADEKTIDGFAINYLKELLIKANNGSPKFSDVAKNLHQSIIEKIETYVTNQ